MAKHECFCGPFQCIGFSALWPVSQALCDRSSQEKALKHIHVGPPYYICRARGEGVPSGNICRVKCQGYLILLGDARSGQLTGVRMLKGSTIVLRDRLVVEVTAPRAPSLTMYFEQPDEASSWTLELQHAALAPTMPLSPIKEVSTPLTSPRRVLNQEPSPRPVAMTATSSRSVPAIPASLREHVQSPLHTVEEPSAPFQSISPESPRKDSFDEPSTEPPSPSRLMQVDQAETSTVVISASEAEDPAWWRTASTDCSVAPSCVVSGTYPAYTDPTTDAFFNVERVMSREIDEDSRIDDDEPDDEEDHDSGASPSGRSDLETWVEAQTERSSELLALFQKEMRWMEKAADELADRRNLFDREAEALTALEKEDASHLEGLNMLESVMDAMQIDIDRRLGSPRKLEKAETARLGSPRKLEKARTLSLSPRAQYFYIGDKGESSERLPTPFTSPSYPSTSGTPRRMTLRRRSPMPKVSTPQAVVRKAPSKRAEIEYRLKCAEDAWELRRKAIQAKAQASVALARSSFKAKLVATKTQELRLDHEAALAAKNSAEQASVGTFHEERSRRFHEEAEPSAIDASIQSPSPDSFQDSLLPFDAYDRIRHEEATLDPFEEPSFQMDPCERFQIHEEELIDVVDESNAEESYFPRHRHVSVVETYCLTENEEESLPKDHSPIRRVHTTEDDTSEEEQEASIEGSSHERFAQEIDGEENGLYDPVCCDADEHESVEEAVDTSNQQDAEALSQKDEETGDHPDIEVPLIVEASRSDERKEEVAAVQDKEEETGDHPDIEVPLIVEASSSDERTEEVAAVQDKEETGNQPDIEVQLVVEASSSDERKEEEASYHPDPDSLVEASSTDERKEVTPLDDVACIEDVEAIDEQSVQEQCQDTCQVQCQAAAPDEVKEVPVVVRQMSPTLRPASSVRTPQRRIESLTTDTSPKPKSWVIPDPLVIPAAPDSELSVVLSRRRKQVDRRAQHFTKEGVYSRADVTWDGLQKH